MPDDLFLIRQLTIELQLRIFGEWTHGTSLHSGCAKDSDNTLGGTHCEFDDEERCGLLSSLREVNGSISAARGTDSRGS